MFFLGGFTVAALASIALARHAEKMTVASGRLALGVSVGGTLLYSVSYEQALFPSDAVAIAGLFLCGAGYYVTTLLAYCELAKVKRLSVAITTVATALFLKTILGSWLSVSAPVAVQVALSCALPVVSFACLVGMERLGSANLDDYRSRKPLSKAGVSDLLFLLVAVSLVLAALRGTSHLGLWGEGYSGSPVSTIAGYVTVGAALSAFAYFTLVRNSNNHMLVRFQPAFLVLAAGFVLYVLQDGFLAFSGSSPLFDWLYLTIELFGHLLSGTLIMTAIRATRIAAWTFQGIGDAAFGLVAIPWVFLAQDVSVDMRSIMVVAIFFVMVAAIRPMSTRPFEIEHSLDIGSALSCPNVAEEGGPDVVSFSSSYSNDALAVPEEPRLEIGTAEEREFSVSPEEFSVERRLSEYYREIAHGHRLSARETDVFMLLAQGRSRPYICEALYLSDGTVKTHISHIYRKFDVHSRQELLDAIQGEIARMDERGVGRM
ncbi:MAG: LuxR C-terminal-related transcriptional regulator [Slackia sp.]|nr:LuxR C-terminal-related transcriptional regulator [Slackia sp.]